MKRYFKRVDADSPLGRGLFYVEYEGEVATRQVERYGDRWYSSRREYNPELGLGLTDRTLSENLASGVLGPECEISREEFEDAWKASSDDRT